jgi:hypothetical protein
MGYLKSWQFLVFTAFLTASQMALPEQSTIEFPEGCYFSSSKSQEEASRDLSGVHFWLRFSKAGTVYRGEIANILTREHLHDLRIQEEKISFAATLGSLVRDGYINPTNNATIDSIVSETTIDARNPGLIFIKFSDEIGIGPELRKTFKESGIKFLLVNYAAMPIPFYSIQCVPKL